MFSYGRTASAQGSGHHQHVLGLRRVFGSFVMEVSGHRSPAGRMMLQMLGVFAEFEHATIVDRSPPASNAASAKANG
jgi:hypothetical protein